MTSRLFLPLASLALALGFASNASAAQAKVTSAVGEPVRKSAAVAAPTWRDATYSDAAATQIRLNDLAISRINEVVNSNKHRIDKPLQIGINRSSVGDGLTKALPVLNWRPAKIGGQVARLKVTSPDAPALRVGLRLDAIDPRAELRFAGSSAPAKVVAATSAIEAKRLSGRGVYWTPSTDGDSQTIEIYLPAGVASNSVKLRVAMVSHLLADSRSGFSILKAFGSSDTCNVDTICRNAALGVNYTNSVKAVARMVFVDAGGTFTCTGTLLADTVTTSQIPYFFTANHCISDQLTANTLETYWGYESATCGGTIEPTPTAVKTGAAYLYSSATTDASLLRLNSAPPAGAFFSGWRSTALAVGNAVIDIHHPSADAKKSSLGQVTSIGTSQHFVGWTSGTTEGGSSGSGLLTATGPSGAYELRGGLYGGSASCANSGAIGNSGNVDQFSRFDIAYPSISQYLAPAGGTFNGPTRDNSGVWYVPAESGWGVTAYQYNNTDQVLFVTWYVYDSTGKANWYQIVGTWTGTDINSGPVRKYTGPNWGPTFNPASVAFTNVGTATLNFTSASTATLTYTVDGQTRTITLNKFGT